MARRAPGEVAADLGPGRPAVAAHLDIAVVGSCPEDARDEGRLGDGRHAAPHRDAVVSRQGALRPALEPGAARDAVDHPHQHLGVPIHVLREVRAHRPGLSAVARREEPVAARMQDARVVGGEEERRVPVPPDRGVKRRSRGDVRVRRILFIRNPGGDGARDALAQIHAPETPVLGFYEHDRRVRRVHLRVEPVPAADPIPVLREDRPGAHGTRPAPAAVVLKARAHVVGAPHVHGGVIGLPDGPRAQRFPGLALVPTHVDRPVVTDDEVVVVGRIDPERVLIDVAVPAQHLPGTAAVARLRHALIHRIDEIRILGGDADLTEVHGASVLVAPELPRAALVRRSPHPGPLRVGRERIDSREPAPFVLLLLGERRLPVRGHFDLGVDNVGIGGRHGEGDPAQRACRQSVSLHGRPCLTSVPGLPDSAPRPSAHEAAHGASALIGGGEQDIGIRRIHDEIRRAGVLIHREHMAPALSSVAGLEHAALGVRAEEMADRGHPHDIRIRRVNEDACDALRLPESRMHERGAAVGALVDTVPERRTLPVVRLARTHVEDIGIGGREGEGADGVRLVAVEDRFERRPVVRRLPQTAGREPHVEDPRVLGVDREIVDAAALPRGADGPPPEALEQRVPGGVDDDLRVFIPRSVLGMDGRLQREDGRK